jgi:hypothetical protein
MDQPQLKPLIMRVGDTGTVWINIIEVCHFYNIPLEVMLKRVATRFGNLYTLDGNNRLLFNNRLLRPEQFNIVMEPTAEEVLESRRKKAEDEIIQLKNDITKQKKLNLLIIERLTTMMDKIATLEGGDYGEMAPYLEHWGWKWEDDNV